MLVSEALNTSMRVLSGQDTVGEALQHMTEQEAGRLPVVNSSTGRLMGQVTKAMLENLENKSARLVDMELEEPYKIFNKEHLFQAIRMMLQHELQILPVVNNDWEFQGIIRKQQVLESLSSMLNLTEFGSVITVELSESDFTLSEIVRLIEAEGGRILGITVETPNARNQAYEISIKLNLQDVSRVASALRRYGYSILTEAESESRNIDLATRADELLKYIDM